MMIHSILSVCVAVVWMELTRGELFSAVVELERVLHAEYDVAQELKAYIDTEQQRINSLKQIADNFEQHSVDALKDPENHVSNPINAFLVVKRFTADWDRVMDKFMRTNSTNEFLHNMTLKLEYFPSYDDLNGAAMALLRLQDMYALSTHDLVRGDVHSPSDSLPMTASDCFEIGRLAYLDSDFYHTVLWMRAALRLLDDDKHSQDFHRAYVLDYLAYATFMQDNVHEALKLSEEILQLDPSNERVLNNTLHYVQMIAQQEADGATLPTDIKNVRQVAQHRLTDEFITYERLCRGENTHELSGSTHLTCQLRRHHPIFYIRPLKEEVVHLEPRIVLFHDVLTAVNIDNIKQLATPLLNRATVHNALTGKLETAAYRVSKSAWLKDDEDVRINRVSQMTHALSNLTLDTGEELQVVNYGVGGHYEPHFDFARKDEMSSFEDWRGNRVATVICYMSDVFAGGATVFPKIGARLVPEKGACALWFNLLPSGEGDYATRHAACPVLLGSKWEVTVGNTEPMALTPALS